MLKVELDASLRIGRDAVEPVPRELLGLLRSIREHGSLIQATREVGLSYRRTLSLLRRWEKISGHELVTLTRGQGTGLTPFGARLAGASDWLEPRIAPRLEGLADELARYLDVPSGTARQRVSVHASHDIAILKLKERIERHLGIELRFKGSLDSLDSLGRGDCDVAGFHIPRPPSLLGPLLTEFAVRLNLHDYYVEWLLSHHQGLIVARSETRRIRGLGDLTRRGLKFVNRERGSGTRLLFDALLARDGVAPSRIRGYEQEEFTHMATAAMVRSGIADAAFGIEAAARAQGLGFVQLAAEDYYLACRRNTPACIAVDTMVATAQSRAFARAVARVGGYEMRPSDARVRLDEALARPAG